MLVQKEADGVPPWCGCGQGRALSLRRCVAGVSEGACKSAWLPRVELRRRLVREEHAARTAIGNAASTGCIGSGDCKREQTFRAIGLPCKACLPNAKI